MVIVLPSKYTPIASGSLIKEPNEHPFDYVRKIRFHCSYMSDVENHVTWDLPDRVAALIVHCLPDHEPYLAVKQRFSDIYLPCGTPNYARYKNVHGQWGLDGDYFVRYLERIERHHCQVNNLPLPAYYQPMPKIPQTVVSEMTDSMSHRSENTPAHGDEVDSSMQVVSPPPRQPPVIVNVPSDTEDEEEEPARVESEHGSSEPMEEEGDYDPDFDVSSYKPRFDRQHNVRRD